MKRRFRVTYWQGRIMETYTIRASNKESACVFVPPNAEHLNVREIYD